MIYRAAILGCGRVSEFHAESYKVLKDVDLVAGIEIDRERAGVFAERFNVPIYETLDECLQKSNLDIVSVCTPHYLHFKNALDCLEKDLNIVIEKPACLSLKHIDKLISLAKAKKKLVTVVFQNQFNESILYLHNLIRLGILGKIKIASIDLRWYRNTDYYNNWHGSLEKSGGGVLITQAIHHVDELVRLLGFPEKVSGIKRNLLHKDLPVEDTISAILEYKNALATINITNISYPKTIEATITLVCENATIKIGGKSFEYIEYLNNKEITDNYPIPKRVKEFFNEYGTSHLDLIENFIKTLQEKSELKVTLESARKTQKVINLIYKSIDGN